MGRAVEVHLVDERGGLEPDEPETPLEAASLGSSGLVGSLMWTLEKGDLWVLAPESAFLFTHCWRKTLVREAYMLERAAPGWQKYREGLATMARRWITGSIISASRSPASSTRTSFSVARATSRSPRACRMRCGRWAACLSCIAVTAYRRRSATTTATRRRI